VGDLLFPQTPGYYTSMRVPVASEPPDNLGQIHGLSPKRPASTPVAGPTAKKLHKDNAKPAPWLDRILSKLGKGPEFSAK
jgi:hypothetical protein